MSVPDVPDEVLAAGVRLFEAEAEHGLSLALVVRHRGKVVYERYGVQPATAFGPGGPVDAGTTLISWSMAKSITQAAVGIAVGDGLLDLDGPAPVPEWRGTDKERITLLQLLEMRPGLLFVEDYVDDQVSHCLEMLYGSGKEDMAAYAAALPLVHEPGSVWNYSSGTTNIVARLLGDALAAGGRSRREATEAFLRERLFGPAGMASAMPTFDPAGTFVGSSYVHATARDFAAFGQLYLDGGCVVSDGRTERILPEGWVELTRTQVAFDEADQLGYGRHWWLWPQFPGAFGAHGYEGQYTVVVPDRDLVVVHLGKSPIEQRPPLRRQLESIIAAYAP